VGAGATAGRAEKAAEAGAGRRPRQRRAPGGGRGGCGGGVRGGPSRGRREEKAAARVGAGRVLERRPRPAAGRGGGGGGRRAQRRSPWWCREEKPGAGQEDSAGRGCVRRAEKAAAAAGGRGEGAGEEAVADGRAWGRRRRLVERYMRKKGISEREGKILGG